jgi:hypothetical protein
MLKAGTAARRRTLSLAEPQTPDELRERIAALLEDIGARLREFNERWIGHVKIMISSGSESTYGSLTAATDRPHWAGALSSNVTNAELTVYAAIYSVSDAQVAQAVDGALARVTSDKI